MSKKYLFIGGPKDGERLCTNGVPEVRFPSQISSLGEIKPDDVLSDTVYCLHESYGPNGQEIAFYAHRKLSYTDTLQMLIDNYQPKSVVSGRVSLDDFSPEAVQDLIQQIKTSNEVSEIDWAKEPERMAEKINFVNVHESWLTNGDELAKRVFQLPTSTVLVFEHLIDVHRVWDMKTKLGAPVISYIESGDFLIFSHRWCIKGQEKVIYPEGE